MTVTMGCSSSRASNIQVTRHYDDVRPTEQQSNKEETRGVPDGQEKFFEARHLGHVEMIRKYRQCQVTESTYISDSMESLEQSLT